VILVGLLYSSTLPLPIFDPVWLGLAAVVAAVVLLAAWIAETLVDRRNPSSKH
jgi:hypothetical protein